MNNESAIVIPARMGSSRFPGKPLTAVLGEPMLHWVIRHSKEAVGPDRTFVASCDDEILEFALSQGVRGIPTSVTHERASDRTDEAVQKIFKEGRKFDHVVMLQGDEPTIFPDDLLKVFESLASPKAPGIVNLMGGIKSEAEWKDPNTIKVVVRDDLSALYFSRSPIPHGTEFSPANARKQVCAIGFTLESLRDFSSLDPDPLEQSESIDMLRWLGHGRSIQMVEIDSITHPVDVALDVFTVEEILRSRYSRF